MKRFFKIIGRVVGTGARALVALVGIAGITAALANYAMTQGAGTNFGSIIVSSVHYAQQLLCDPTTPSQCQAVSAGGAAKVDGSSVTQPVSASSLPLPAGAATSANQSSQITQETATATASGTPADTAANSGSGSFSIVAMLKGIYNQLSSLITAVTSSIPAGGNIIGKVGVDQTADGTTNGVRLTSQYPSGATPITASATGTTAATTATLAGTTGKTTYICSLSIRSNATAAATGNGTVTGTITGTLNFTHWSAPAASGVGITEQIYTPCVPASGQNTGIAVASPAPGAGGVVSVSATGYQL